MRTRPVAIVTLINAMEDYEWTEAPERPDAEAIDRLRAYAARSPVSSSFGSHATPIAIPDLARTGAPKLPQPAGGLGA